jgi:dTDP-4-dehydrorhamnose 3,5-epimerase
VEILKTPISDLLILQRKIVRDNRGFFTRLYAERELSELGRPTNAVHINSSTSTSIGTLRGIHFQYPPYAEAKIVSCVNGAVWDVGVDLRPQSSTRFQWFGVKLTPQNGVSLLIPEGFGHAFITLKPSSTVVYALSAEYSIKHESGLKFDDPMLDIKWPIRPKVLSEKDLNWGSIESRLSELDLNFKEKRPDTKSFNP